MNSTVTALSKHQFGRAAGIEGNLKTEVVDAAMMLVPDVRKASAAAAARAIAACKQIAQRDTKRYLYQEFSLDDRRELDDATLEILGIEDAEERAALRDRLYRDFTALQQAIRERELIAQRDRARVGHRDANTPQYIADELWSDHASDLYLLQFPEDFVTHPNEGEIFDLPPGEVEVGSAMVDVGNLLRVGTIRVGGRDGEVIDVGSIPRGQYLQALSLCNWAGLVRLPGEEACSDAVREFDQYRQDLRDRCFELAQERTSDKRRQKAIAEALLRKALRWRKTDPTSD